MNILVKILILASLTLSMNIPCETINNRNISHTYDLSPREKIVSTSYNFDMIIDNLDGTVSKSIMDQGIWQISIVHLTAYFLKPHFQVLNVGSQTGLQAIIIGNLIKPLGKLYIFQPYSISYAIVKKNIYLNDLEDITKIYKVGASDSQAKAQMLIYPENTGGAQIFLSNPPQINPQRNIMKQIVQVDLIDQIIPKDVIINFVLMDVQKMEVQALLGMKDIIQRSKDIIILLQWQYLVNSKRNQAKTIRLLKWIKQKKLRIYKYLQNEANKCIIGKFELLQDVYDLLTLPVMDILIIPNHIDPNKYSQI